MEYIFETGKYSGRKDHETPGLIEEVSTTHFKDDSYYDDEGIVNNKTRKTELTFWSDWLEKEII